MNAPQYFEVLADHARYDPVGQVSLQESVDLISAAICHAAEQDIKRLLVNVTGLVGLGAPETFDRYFLSERFAKDSKRVMKMVLVAGPELIDRDKFGVTVARNRGLSSNIFSDEGEAVDWLLGGGLD